MTRKIIIAILMVFFSCYVAQAAMPKKYPSYHRYACGPQVLATLLEGLGKHPSYEGLFESSQTKGFITNLEGMQKGLEENGVKSGAYRIAAQDIPQLSQKFFLICHTKRNHYVLLTRSEGPWVWIIDTYLAPGPMQLPLEVFASIWDGAVLAVARQPGSGQPRGLAHLVPDESKQIIGGQPNCQNTNGSNSADNGRGTGSKGNSKKYTEEPVNVTNGNFFTERTDLAIPGRGLPLELTRTYNSQITSFIEGWTPDQGAGSWSIEDGELSGQGDRILTNQIWGDGTIIWDMRTVEKGDTYDYEVGWLNFRYQDERNRYYVLLHTNGILELSCIKQNNRASLRETATPLDPERWNKFQVQTTTQANGLRIRISVNDVIYIDFLDTAPLGPGRVVLEAYYCHSHYDNIGLADAIQSASYTFDVDDNDRIFGYGWTSVLDCQIRELSNGDLLLLREAGRTDRYVRQANGSYLAPAGVYDSVSKDAGGYTLARIKENIVYRFDTGGQIVHIRDRNGNTIQFQYSSIQVP